MKFDWQLFKDEENIGIVCSNKSEAIDICKVLNDNDILWGDGDKYTEENGLALLELSIEDKRDLFPCIYYADRSIGALKDHKEEYGELFNASQIINNYTVDLL